MAKTKYKYILNPGNIGDLYTAPMPERKEGGKFELSKELSQAELAFLHENGHAGIITKVELPDEPVKSKKIKE